MPTYSSLTITPITLTKANQFVDLHHRHHSPVTGHKFSIAVADETGEIRGVVIVGRPVARNLDDGWTLEVNRLATDGARNACSMLYSAAWRASKAMGYRKLVTYILSSETGASLRAANWRCVGECGGGSWSRKSRPRTDPNPTEKKIKWETQK
jgi:hypothetical protein